MLAVALDYREAVDRLCAQRDSGLRAYELTEREWGILEELRDVLKVRARFHGRVWPGSHVFHP